MPELDVLRAFAFLAVFFSHWIPREPDYYIQHRVPAFAAYGLTAFSFMGSVGVMVFFCLSSYLITGLLLKEIQNRGHVDVRAFYMRRLLRIWPLYMAFTALALVMPYLDPEQIFGWKHGLAFLLFSGNWIWALHVPVQTIAVPLWSLSVEEQFYLCWPWVVRKSTTQGLRNTAFVLLFLATSNRLLILLHVYESDLWHNTFTQFDSIALGALLAVGLPESVEQIKKRARGFFLVAALLGIFAIQFFEGPEEVKWLSMFYFPFVSVCCAVILWCFVGMQLNLKSRIVKSFISLGKISYGLYVIHFLANYLVLKAFVRIPFKMHFLIGFTVRGVASLLLTIVLASISYKWLEMPFLKLKTRFSTDIPQAKVPAPVEQIPC
jgi:peptidoglycan/LPS O-acetylase OafA/YrhL